MLTRVTSPQRIVALFMTFALLTFGCVGAQGGESAAAESGTDATRTAQQDQAGVSCEMTFNMKGWSAIVSKSEGEGVITCDNGQTADVKLSVTGGGLTFGKTEIEEGKGSFTRVRDISEIFGSYAQAEAAAGTASAARSAQALTKDNVSLTITADGRGWTLGVSGAKFTIERDEG